MQELSSKIEVTVARPVAPEVKIPVKPSTSTVAVAPIRTKLGESLGYDREEDGMPALTVFVVGLGGTGGYVLRDLARYAYYLRVSKKAELNIVLYDGDTVEEKNLLRQNFITSDQGKYKAEVLAKRYSAAFGVDIKFVNEYLSTKNMVSLNYGRSIIISCTDSNDARRLIHNEILRSRVGLVSWIDSGNEKRSGQVILGEKNRGYSGFQTFKSCIELFPELADPANDPVDTRSCADVGIDESQNLFINSMAAMMVMNFVRVLVENEWTNLNGVSFGINGVSTPIFIDNK